MTQHVNNGDCPRCEEIFRKYPGFHQKLYDWFKSLQELKRTCHISECGRGKELQELFYMRGASRAHYGESAHNYNCAIDVFGMVDGRACYLDSWYEINIGTQIPSWLCWYGDPKAKFREKPHIEVRDWKELKINGVIKLVE